MSTGRTSTDDGGILSNSIPKWSPAAGRSDPFYDVKARPSCTRQSFEMKYNGRGTLNRIEKSGEIRSTSATQRLSYVWCWAKYMLQATKSKSALISLASREQKCRLRNRHNIGTWSGNWGSGRSEVLLGFLLMCLMWTPEKNCVGVPYMQRIRAVSRSLRMLPAYVYFNSGFCVLGEFMVCLFPFIVWFSRWGGGI